MPWLFQTALALLCSVVFLPFGASAAGVALQNDLDAAIKAIYCVDNDGVSKKVIDALAKGATKTVAPEMLPEYACSRLAVSLQNGMGWQYYHEPEPAAAKRIVFAMESAGRYEKDKYPSLLIELPGGDAYAAPAGVPMFILAQLMETGMDIARWKGIATPGYESLKDKGAFVVSFADQSWSFAGKGLVFAASGAGGEVLKSLTLVGAFANTTVAAAFEEMKREAWTPLLLRANGKAQAFGAGGASLDSAASPVACPATNEGMWTALETRFQESLEGAGKKVELLFGKDHLLITFGLDLDTARANITLARVGTAAGQP